MTRQEELEAMSEFNINCLVAAEIEPRGERTFKDYDLEEIRICYDRLCVDGSVNTDFDIVDYCNNPGDIMPISIENRIGIIPRKNGDWSANQKIGMSDLIVEPGPLISFDKNPFRAICIVFILMSESKS